MIKNVIIFLVLNFVALGLGGFFTGEGVPSSWYQELNQAPWTPPGWVFGAAWTSIMVAFAFYMAFILEKNKAVVKNILILFTIQWFLNVGWNPLFFALHQVGLALFVIVLLTIVVFLFLIKYYRQLKWRSLLILPYLIWLLIATSLNAYIWLYN